MRQAVMRGERGDVRQLGLVRAQKLLARGNVEEQIADRDGGTGRPRKFVATEQLPAGELDGRAGGLFGRARFKHQPGDGGDGRQRLAAKAERGDGKQIPDVAQFAGGVALEGQQRVVAQHAAAVVGDANQMPAAALHLDAKIGGAGVERIFEQFLDDGGGALHHLSGRDLVGDRVGEDAYSAHVTVLRAHRGQELAVAAGLAQLVEQQFHALDGRQRVQHPAQNIRCDSALPWVPAALPCAFRSW